MSQRDNILKITNYKFHSFENASNYAFDQLIEKLQELNETKKGFPNLNSALQSITKGKNFVDEYINALINHLPDTLERISQHANINQEIFSLCEMAIIYLFKNLEIAIKRTIKIAYPQVNTRDLFNWKEMNNFLSSKDIDVNKLKGFKEFDELRKVNNNLKHGEYITSEVKTIKEFKGMEKFEFPNLMEFYVRVRDMCEKFLSEIGNSIIQDLYYFTEERLEKMADSFRERMDDKTIEIFIKLLK